ncbi:hypothetical protein AM493_10175 [Flavobacterium akiainvivens]|uniref:Uncharacterized protein n=1 Tax=Flavobacterium akiainvivens TaxID=1202724 RepID=A0A0M8MLL3_9FLAO|nr:hypothetical protein AM493_10175 [Flavobacterium akiainvivens]
MLIATLLFSVKTIAQPALTQQAQISLLTCGAGNELYSIFGHTAIRVNEPSLGIDVVYNFGTFDFDTGNFYLKFVKGDLQYYVSASTYADFVYTYQYYNRDVLEQKLNLTQEQKQQISNELYKRFSSDEKYYTYKFFDRNCTTMVGDILEMYVPGKLSMKNSDAGRTNRQIIYSRLNNKFYENLGISLIFGHKTDLEQYKLFLPTHLMEGVANTATPQGALAPQPVTVFKATTEPETSVWNNYYTYAAVCLVLMYFSRKQLVQRSLLAIFGLLGIFFTFVGFYSFHEEITQNYNALLINPLLLLVLVFIFAGNAKAAKITAWICLACTALYLVLMLNKPHLIAVLPLMALIILLLLEVLGIKYHKNKAVK